MIFDWLMKITINKPFLIPNAVTSSKSRFAIFERKSIFPLLEVKDEMAVQCSRIRLSTNYLNEDAWALF